tara:strand:- start:1133 stop:1720 length:588 start_codon:yes stop_codon:yes gene_type:complete
MKANEILDKIKNIVGVDLSEKTKLAEMKLENGTIIVAESFESGKSIFIKTEEEEIALPVGEYKLEDGKILVVTEEGLIDSINEAVAEEEVADEDLTKKEETDLEDETEEMKYVTKEEFTSAVEEIKAMIEDKMGDKEEMKEDVIEDTKEELSAVAPSPLKHNPEAEVDNKINFKISENRIKTTKDRVFDKIFNNN